MYEKIKGIHLELSEKCNGMCLMCNHNIQGEKINPYLKNRILSLNDIKTILPISILKDLDYIMICGVFGEPICNDDLLDICKYFKKINPDLMINIMTNGSLKSSSWWVELAKYTDNVFFSIDGLSDTYSIYRKNLIYENVINNAKIFIKAGGVATWDFIVFRHNEHQVDEAKNLSKELGFQNFNIKKSHRFFNKNFLENTNIIKQPKNKKYINTNISQERILEKHGTMKNYVKNTTVNCMTAKKNEIYITAEGLIFPCCWIASTLYSWYLKPKESEVWTLFKNKKDINAKYNSIFKIINGECFKKIEKSFNENNKNITICGIICGEKYKPLVQHILT